MIDLISSDYSTDDQIISDQKQEFIKSIIKKLNKDVALYVIDYFGLYNREPLSMKEVILKYNMPESKIRYNMTKQFDKIRKKNVIINDY